MKVQYIVLFACAFLMLVEAAKKGGKKCGTKRIVSLATHQCQCTGKTEGTLNYRDGKLLLCNGDDWVEVSFESKYGTEDEPGTSCKDILEKGKAAAKNGVYFITLEGIAGSFPVYCDMNAGGYTMVFKAVAGNGRDIYAAYMSSGTNAEFQREALDVTNRYRQGHYKNRIVWNWAKFNPAKVRVVLYSEGEQELEMTFNGASSDNQNWFSADKLLRSPYSDIQTEPRNFFSIRGDNGLKRNFFINRSYGGCGADLGWLTTTGTGCDWEKAHAFPGIIYSKLGTYTNWNKGGNVGSAQVLAVYVQ